MARPLTVAVALALVACGGDDKKPQRDTSVAIDSTPVTETITPTDTTPDTAPQGCGELTFEGCCTADARLKYCLDDVLEVAVCIANEELAACGWVEESGGFDCSDQGTPSPTPATFPYLCPGETAPTNPCAGRACGFALGTACGTCTEGLACTEAGQCADPCLNKECGEFAGKQCGTCPTAGDICNSTGQCGPNVCGSLGFEGCCDGDATYWCEDNEVVTEDCRTLYDTGCGWIPFDEDAGDGDYYYCDGSGADPTATHPSDCDDYVFTRPE